MMTVSSWGYHQGGRNQTQRIDEMGSKLSIALGCPVHYLAWGKNMFQCHCNITFPVFIVEAAVDSGDWGAVEKRHKEGM